MVAEEVLDVGGVLVFVGLGAGGLDGRAFGAVEHAELDAGGVDGVAHEAAEGVDFADHLALGQAADGGIAGHAADGQGVHGDHRHSAAVAEDVGGGPGGLRAGMAAADDEDVEGIGHGPGPHKSTGVYQRGNWELVNGFRRGRR